MVNNDIPLAVRLRPRTLNDFVGQEHILGKDKLLARVINSKRLPPLIFHGPAGCGKTTLGFIIAKTIEAEFTYLNAAFTNTKEVKTILLEARKRLKEEKRKTIVFIDEIHRFNKLQQESLVPDTETGSIIFIGATLYNPSYYLIPSLVSRALIASFKPLAIDDLLAILKRSLKDKDGLSSFKLKLDDEALRYIATAAAGDARKALTSLEVGALTTAPNKKGVIVITQKVARDCIQKNLFYDKKDSYHYDTISAFIKSMRGSDVDSALYWLAKMIVSGEDPRFIARRMVILASEDIGNANPFALVLATSCFQSVEFVGLPEARLILAQTVIYLASSVKSNASYLAIDAAERDVREEETKEVPGHIKTHSKDYKYPHSYGGYVEQEYGARRQYYFPKNVGTERKIKEFLETLRKLGTIEG